MWLIADSGSTKTEWRLFDSNGIIDSKITKGLNPLFLSKSSFTDEVANQLPELWFAKVTKLWFYSAGCGSEDINKQTEEWLASVFTNAKIEVESDLIAAARATCGSKKGVFAILGTGSNSAYYDGATIIDHIKPLGYILGDEGSGVALGKALLKKLLRNQFPADLSESIYKELGLNYAEFINNVYHSEWPNRFIASCTRVLHSHKNEPIINSLINYEFEQFVMLLKSYPIDENSIIHFVGSVAHFFESNLKEVLENNGLILGYVLQSPINGLQEYHLGNN